MGFNVLDKSGNPVDTDVVGSIQLDGVGVPDPLPDHTFNGIIESLNGHLDTTLGIWIYGDEFSADNYFKVNFDRKLLFVIFVGPHIVARAIGPRLACQIVVRRVVRRTSVDAR